MIKLNHFGYNGYRALDKTSNNNINNSWMLSLFR